MRLGERVGATVVHLSRSLQLVDVERGTLTLIRGGRVWLLNDSEKERLARYLETRKEHDDGGD